MRTIETDADVIEGLAHLCACDPVLLQARKAVDAVPLRRSAAGFKGLTRIVMGQQLSVHAADAIATRLEARLDPFTPQRLLRMRDSTLRTCGLSGPKIRAMRSIARALDDEHLNLDALPAMPPEEAISHLTAVKGIGPWTAEIYLLFCVGHADIFPAGDLALRVAWQDLAQLGARPSPRELAETALNWRPWRGVAARLLWSYYRAAKQGRSGAPL